MEAVVHLTSGEADRWRLACGRVERLLSADVEFDRVTLLVELDGAALLTEEAATAEDVEDLLNNGVRVATNRNCLENRDIPLTAVVDDVVVLDNSTLELVRLQDNGASIVTVP